MHGLVEDGVNGGEGEILVGAATGEVDGFAGGVDEESGVDGGFGFEVFDDLELALGFLDDVGAVLEVFRGFSGGLEEFAGLFWVNVGDESVGVATEGVKHGLVVLLVAGGEVATVGGGGEGLGEGFEGFLGEFIDDESGFLGGGDGVADFGFEGFEEFWVGMVEIDDVLPLFVGARGDEDFALPFEAVVGEGGGVEVEFLEDFAVVVADGYWGVGSDGEGEAVMLFAPGEEELYEIGGEVVGEPDVVVVVFGRLVGVGGAV